ncbi:hypothetical protein CDD83_8260 [Cordyceps sp. RAO-2017]|nr:hypothetical protein CDD83_8260 [Cordyceps sp. RAO-2017]
MRLNEKTAVATSDVLLVPYEEHHVRTYHAWMQDPGIREATASEALSLDEEYENQRSWRRARDKLTFIVCEPLAPSEPAPARPDAEDRMRGDVNLFLHPCDDDSDDDDEGGGARRLTGEVDVMIAGPEHRGRGLGGAAVRALLAYLRRHGREALAEYAGAGAPPARLGRLMAKIRADNAGSAALFRRLGFRQTAGPDYFGELTFSLAWRDVEAAVDAWAPAHSGYRELPYGGG